MNDKLQANADHFGNENTCIAYVVSRLGGDAAEHTFARRRHDASHSYTSTDELFEHLEGIYGELDRNRKCRREYNALRQTDKPFNVFYSDFMKLSSYLGYDDRTLMDDLQNKINNRLQDALSVCPEDFTSLTRLRTFLQGVDNKQRANYQLRSQLRTAIAKATVVPDKRAATSLPAVTTSVTEYVKPTTFPTPEPARSPIVCYTCKAPGHLFKDCPQNKAGTPAPRAFTPRLHEIVIPEDKEDEEMSSFEDSEAKN